MGVQVILITGIVIISSMVVVLWLDYWAASKQESTKVPLQLLRNFYLESTFPLTSPLTETQFRAIKQTLIYLTEYEQREYEKIPLIFDALTPDEVKDFAKNQRMSHLENHQKWRQINYVFTRLRITDELLLETINELMHDDAELVLRAWGILIENSLEPLDAPASSPVDVEEEEEDFEELDD